MNKKILSSIFVVFILFIFLIWLYHSMFSNKAETGMVCFENHCFQVEIAKTPQKLKKGLMFRKDLKENQGMLFIFEKEDIYPFWMKNTLIPLDIIWLDSNKKIVYIEKNAQPCKENNVCLTITPDKKAKYVLEVLGGVSQKINLKIEDKASFYY